jgi:sugar phosphate isomerase/epimerase
MTRRAFLGQSASAAAGVSLGAAGAHAAGDGAGRRIRIGAQLYSVRQQCAKDLPGTLAVIARIGYRGVEFAGYHGRSAQELRALLDDLGLVACGTHTPYETVLGERLAETVEFNRVLGNRYLIVPSMQGRSRQEWLDKAKLFDELAERVKADGMWIGYHAHAHDFQTFDGVSAWDLFFGSTRPEVVMQLDTSNCRDGGADPVAVLRKYPGRARTIHIKANGAGPEAAIGEDRVDWPGVFGVCETTGGTEWYVVEHETSQDPIDAVRRNYAALRRLGKV